MRGSNTTAASFKQGLRLFMEHIAGIEKTAEFYAVELALQKKPIERLLRAVAIVEHRRMKLDRALKPRKNNEAAIESDMLNLQTALIDLDIEMKRQMYDQPQPAAWIV